LFPSPCAGFPPPFGRRGKKLSFLKKKAVGPLPFFQKDRQISPSRQIFFLPLFFALLRKQDPSLWCQPADLPLEDWNFSLVVATNSPFCARKSPLFPPFLRTPKRPSFRLGIIQHNRAGFPPYLTQATVSFFLTQGYQPRPFLLRQSAVGARIFLFSQKRQRWTFEPTACPFYFLRKDARWALILSSLRVGRRVLPIFSPLLDATKWFFLFFHGTKGTKDCRS